MVDRSIRMDERTDRLVTALAYFLKSSKKSILRDAVAEFAETHHPRPRGARDGGQNDGTRDDGQDNGMQNDGMRNDGVQRWNGSAGVEEFAESTASVARGESPPKSVPARVDELAEARARGVTFEMLDPADRLALRRRELVRQFAERGGTNVRVLDPAEAPGASAGSPGRIVLLAETDPVDGSAAIPVLEEVARGVLGVHATVVSLTALRLFGSGRHERALAQSRPL